MTCYMLSGTSNPHTRSFLSSCGFLFCHHNAILLCTQLFIVGCEYFRNLDLERHVAGDCWLLLLSRIGSRDQPKLKHFLSFGRSWNSDQNRIYTYGLKWIWGRNARSSFGHKCNRNRKSECYSRHAVIEVINDCPVKYIVLQGGLIKLSPYRSINKSY